MIPTPTSRENKEDGTQPTGGRENKQCKKEYYIPDRTPTQSRDNRYEENDKQNQVKALRNFMAFTRRKPKADVAHRFVSTQRTKGEKKESAFSGERKVPIICPARDYESRWAW
jgi:hypothetical protein